MSTEVVSEQPKQGMSTRKKWLIGCGGCLGVLLVLTVIAVLALSMGWDALQKASGGSVKAVFGESYDATGYTAMGLPLNQAEVKNMALLIPNDRSSMIFAIDTKASQAELDIVQSGDPAQLKAYFVNLGAQFLKSSASQGNAKLKDIQFGEPYYATIDASGSNKGKRYPVVFAIAEAESKGSPAYMPCVVALVPEADNRVISLLSMGIKATSETPLPSFKDEQAQLFAELERLIKDSELDDRLISTPK